MSARTPFLFELLCEEIPAGVVGPATEVLGDKILEVLTQAEVTDSKVQLFCTPRRLSVFVDDVALAQQDKVEEVAGPPARAAYDAEGKPTKAAAGFAKGQGVEIDALYTLETPKGPYVACKKAVRGRPTATLLAEALPRILGALPFPKRMRWGREREAFIRPVHQLVALLGADIVPFAYAGVESGRITRGHRFLGTLAPISLADASIEGYLAALRKEFVEPDPSARRAEIRALATDAASRTGGMLVEDEGTLATVTQLVEWPHAIVGSFSPLFLEIPGEVIQTTLRANQKLFTVMGPGGKLLPHFVAIPNTCVSGAEHTIASGNARVVAARLSDGRFFYEQDRKGPLETYVEALSGRIFLAGLGTVRDRVARLQKLSVAIARALGYAGTDSVSRAALLCKADLSTMMVGEFPELQGVMGEYYAASSGETSRVGRAIREHYLPRFAGDELPVTEEGQCVALADKLDLIAGCFGLGLEPSGAQDPYALRRAAIGVLRIVAESNQGNGLPLGLGRLLDLALDAYATTGKPFKESANLPQRLQTFFRGRLKAFYADRYPADVVEAVLEADFDTLADIAPRIDALSSLRSNDDFEPLARAFKRATNITRGHADAMADVVESAFEADAERALWSRILEVQGRVSALLDERRFMEALAVLVTLKPSVDAFFDQVMVMVENDAVRRNRLALLGRIGALFGRIADFGRIQVA